jgi:5-(carboxyamino)imidazole ribonucleotide synthase
MKIGIIGAGQLGRMLALAGYPLALQFRFLDSSAESPGGQVGPIVTGAFDDPASLERLAADVDLVTYEFENVPVGALQHVATSRPCLPPVEALRVSQDRLLEKELFTRLGIPTTPFRAVDSRADLLAAVAALGLPCVLKTRRLGYDGKGQHYLRRASDVASAWTALGGVPLVLEGFIRFDREVSIIGARSTAGEVRAYPIVENTHRAGILRVTRAPHRNARLQKSAEAHLRRLLRHFDYAGILTIEFFVERGRLVANHLRAILGLPLGDTRPLGHCAMVNFIGQLPARDAVLALPGVHFHDYGKAPRAGRKIGHCTIVASTATERDRLLRRVLRLLPR